MDLLRNMAQKRQEMMLIQNSPLVKYEPQTYKTDRKKTKTEKAKEHIPGTKGMKKFIQEERPNNKVVREHLRAIIDNITASSSDEE